MYVGATEQNADLPQVARRHLHWRLLGPSRRMRPLPPLDAISKASFNSISPILRFGPAKPRLARRSADANRQIVPKSLLLLLAIAALVICNLHSPSMLHAEDGGHDDHAALVEGDHHDLLPEHAPDVDHGTLAHDHHVPTAMTASPSRMETPAPTASQRHELAEASELVSWATAPPIEPPAA